VDFLHAAHFKIVAAGGDLDAAAEILLQKEAVTVDIERSILEDFTSQFPQPITRYELGSDFMVKGVLSAATLDRIVELIGGTNTSEVYTKTQQVLVLSKYDIRLGVYRPSDGVVVPWTFTDMQNIAKVSFKMEHGSITYLPFEFRGTYTSDLTIDNSVT
jgi:hypothetical protein